MYLIFSYLIGRYKDGQELLMFAKNISTGIFENFADFKNKILSSQHDIHLLDFPLRKDNKLTKNLLIQQKRQKKNKPKKQNTHAHTHKENHLFFLLALPFLRIAIVMINYWPSNFQ